MLTVGVDIVDIHRMGRYVSRFGDHFLRQIYSPIEISQYVTNLEQLAGAFAAKEAAAKALGVGFAHLGRFGVLPVDIEVTSLDPLSAPASPQIVLHNGARQRADDLQLARWTLAVVRLKGYVTAFVTATSADVPAALTDAEIAGASRSITHRQFSGKSCVRSTWT